MKFYSNWLKPIYKDAKTIILDTLYPVTCLVCGSEGEFLCAQCRPALKRLDGQICIACKKPSIGGLTHPYCQTPHGADGLISLLDYHDEAVSEALITGKYSFVPGVYETFGSMLAEFLHSSYFSILHSEIVLVPIPLSGRRQRWRGFNQAQILCKAISEKTGLPTLNLLVRQRHTKTQKDLKREARLKNMENAFAISPPVKEEYPAQAGGGGTHNTNSAKGRSFLLVDDVTTTGTTLLEAAKVLKRNGAGKVYCLTVARD